MQQVDSGYAYLSRVETGKFNFGDYARRCRSATTGLVTETRRFAMSNEQMIEEFGNLNQSLLQRNSRRTQTPCFIASVKRTAHPSV